MDRRRRSAELLADIDVLLAEVDSDLVAATVADGVAPAVDGFIAWFDGDSYAAARHMMVLVDNDGNPRTDDPFGLSHPDGCACTLCLDVADIPADEGEPWLAACPAMTVKDRQASGFGEFAPVTTSSADVRVARRANAVEHAR